MTIHSTPAAVAVNGKSPVTFIRKVNLLVRCVLFVGAFFICSVAHAQYSSNNINSSGLALSAGAGIDVPMHNLNGVYKAAPSFDLGVTKSVNNFLFGVSAGYRSYQPKQSYYPVTDEFDGSTLGAINYSNFSVFSIYASATYNVDLSDRATFYGGLNVGSNYAHYSYYAQAGNDGDEESFTNGYGYIAPKLGVSFALANNLRLGAEARYNLFGSANYNYDSYYGSSSSSILYTSFSAGITLHYLFP